MGTRGGLPLLATAALASCVGLPGSLGGNEEEEAGSDGSLTTETDSDDGTEESTGDGPKMDILVKFDTGGKPPPDFPETCEEAEAINTSVGCTFYPLAFPGSLFMYPPGFAVGNVGNETAHVTLSNLDGELAGVDVPPGEVYVMDTDQSQLLPQETGVTNLGYVIESDQPLQAFQFLPRYPWASADASILLPEQTLGTKHRVAGYNDGQTNSLNFIAVTAVEDGTEVTLTLAAPHSQIEAGGSIPALDYDQGDETTTVSLDRLQVVVFVARATNTASMEIEVDLSGSLIESTKPVVVYSGTEGVMVKPGTDYGFLPFFGTDLIASAIPPTTVWGHEYSAVKTLPVGLEMDVWRFIANRDDTEIVLEGDENDVILLDEGQFFDVATAGNFWATGNEAFAMVHLTASGTQTGPMENFDTYDCTDPLIWPGSPAMAWTYARGNWLSRYLVVSGVNDPELDPNKQWCHDHITLVGVLSQWDEIAIDGEAPPAPTAIGDTGLGYAYVPAPGPYHDVRTTGAGGIEVMMYGYQSDGSYLYPGGMGLLGLNPEG